MKTNEAVEGKHDTHNFDVVVANGKAYGAVQALSFEVQLTDYLRREVDSTAWSLDDVRRANRGLSLGVFVLPPKGKENKEEFSRATKLFKSLGADVLTNEGMPSWAKKRAKLIASKSAHRE